MIRLLHFCQLIISISYTLAKNEEVDLPPCPQSMSYFPQQMPMHCKMVKNRFERDVDPFSIFRRPKQPEPIAVPIPGLPDMTKFSFMDPQKMTGMSLPSSKLSEMALPMPGMPSIPASMLGSAVPGMPGMPSIPKNLPMPMPMPMPMPVPGAPPHKLPVIVMPFYSPDPKSHKKHSPKRDKNAAKRPRKRHRHKSTSETDSSDDSDDTSDTDDSRDNGWWRKNQGKRNRKKYGIYRRFNKHHNNMKKKKNKGELLTPILQYVTKDGYVIFEKHITKNEASDWLGPNEEAKAKEEIHFQKGLEIVTSEPQEEYMAPDENNKGHKKKSKQAEDREINEMDEIEEFPREYPPVRHKLSRIGTLLENHPQS